MLITNLPDKKEWARQIDMLRRVNKVIIRDLAQVAEISEKTMQKVLKGDTTWDHLHNAELSLKIIVDKKRNDNEKALA